MSSAPEMRGTRVRDRIARAVLCVMLASCWSLPATARTPPPPPPPPPPDIRQGELAKDYMVRYQAWANRIQDEKSRATGVRLQREIEREKAEIAVWDHAVSIAFGILAEDSAIHGKKVKVEILAAVKGTAKVGSLVDVEIASSWPGEPLLSSPDPIAGTAVLVFSGTRSIEVGSPISAVLPLQSFWRSSDDHRGLLVSQAVSARTTQAVDAAARTAHVRTLQGLAAVVIATVMLFLVIGWRRKLNPAAATGLSAP